MRVFDPPFQQGFGESCDVIVTFFISHDSDSIFRRILLGYYAEGMHANFKENEYKIPIHSVSVSVSVFRRTLLGYYAEGMHANF